MPSKFSREILQARLAALLLFSLVPPATSDESPMVIRPPLGPAFRDDRILIIPKLGHAGELSRFSGQVGARVLKAFPETANIHVLALPKGASAPEYVRRYRQSGHVQVADLDYWIDLAALPNDPAFITGGQWHLNNTGQDGGVADADIDAPEAWDTLNSASNIIVAVIDSGIRQTHEDLAGNLWVNPSEIPGNGIDDDHDGIVDDVHGLNAAANSGDLTDNCGHGTHVAGILGAVGNNGLGVCGVSWRVQIMACKFLTGSISSCGGSESDLIQCLDYARLKGAKVINCSIVTPSTSAALSNAFWAVRNAGIVVVAAAGNSGTDNDVTPYYPASFAMDNVVAVTATTRADEFANLNYGANSVHLGAPGVDILSTFYRSDADYATQTGTSLAAPCVAGAIALLRARFPSADYRQLIARVLATTDPLPSLTGRCITGGRLNLARALGTGGFTAGTAPFAWIATNAMTSIVLSDDGVSTPQPLPFAFSYYGQTYGQVYIGANGLMGFTSSNLGTAVNADLPTLAAPNAIICPYWDDLNPALGGSVWLGALGAAPNRKFIVSWFEVPHKETAGGLTRFTFQVILHETGPIAFQYLQVESGRNTLLSGRSATVGVEDSTGWLATKYSYNGSPLLLTNNQTILFMPQDAGALAPTLVATAASQKGQLLLGVFGQPGQPCVLSTSLNLAGWTPILSNRLPASGVLIFTNSSFDLERRFYRAEMIR
jgi:hypothetical protein